MATAPPPGDGGRRPSGTRCPAASGPARADGTSRRRTTWLGDAVPRNEVTGPAQRHAAHSAKDTTDGGGPTPLEPERGLTTTSAVAPTSSSTTQPPTRRPWRSIRTRLPTPTSGANAGGTE